MKNQIHILNGDALKLQFPKSIQGEIVIARECLVDGDVEGNDLDKLFDVRAKFLSQHYGGTEQEYFGEVVPEFIKIMNIKAGTDVILWFEDDLFCQVNFWFVVYLLIQKSSAKNVFLVRPKQHTPYGFGGLSEIELVTAYEMRIRLTDLEKIAALWQLYQDDNTQKMLKYAEELEQQYPFLLVAVKAHIDRIPVNGKLGRPLESLKAIVNELKTEEFGKVFQEFCKRESIYGFGDLQVKRLYDKIVNKD